MSGMLTKPLPERLAASASRDTAVPIIFEALRYKLSLQLQLAFEDIHDARSMSAHGDDSLIALELRAWSFRELRLEISMIDLLGSSSIMDLASTTADKWMRRGTGGDIEING